MKIKVRFQDGANFGELTTNHAASSYGLPVFIPGFALSHYMKAPAYGPADLANEPPLVICEEVTADQLSAIKSAGFNIAI